MATSVERSKGLDLAALDAITEAVESGAGLPDVVRAATASTAPVLAHPAGPFALR